MNMDQAEEEIFKKSDLFFGIGETVTIFAVP
jgi:hypothetical protein